MMVTAMKQGYEDWIRHSADNLVNNRSVNTIQDGKLVVSGCRLYALLLVYSTN